MKNFHFNPRWNKYFILLLFGFFALLIRAPGLGKWCFTVDEYYYYNSVNYILEKGIPQFPSGGYYVRGPLIQYLIALTSLVFPEPEFAARFVPLVFGVLSIPLFFLVCTHFLPTFPAFLCTSILLLSSWNIEFSRFARMYAPFQCLFFSFIYFYYSGYFLNNRNHKIFSWCIAYLSILVSEGSIIIPFILLLPILLDISPLNRINLRLISSVIILIGFNYFVYGINYRSLGVINPYPKEIQVEKQLDSSYEKEEDITIVKIAIDLKTPFRKSSSLMSALESIPVSFGDFLSVMGGRNGTYPMEYQPGKIFEVTPLNQRIFTIRKLGIDLPLLLPKSDMLWGVWKSVLLSIGYLLCVMGGICVFIVTFRNRDDFWEKIAIFLSALLPLVYQYGLLFYILILLFVSHKSLFRMFFEKRKYWIPYIVSTILFWILGWVTTRELLFPGENLYSKTTKIFLQLFDYPRSFEAVYIPFFKVVPMLGILVFFMLFTSSFFYFLKEEENKNKFLILVIIICIVMVSTFKTLYMETRYSYFYFPLLFILMYTETVSMKDFAVKYFGGEKMKKFCNIILIVPLVFFLISEDFHLDHVSNVSAKEINFRTGMYNKYSPHWYPRVDLKSPSEFVNKVYRHGDIIVVGAVTSAYYLEKPYINYITFKSDRFMLMSRKEGKEEIWTGRPLVYNLMEFFRLVPSDPDNSLWLIAGIKDCMADSFGYSNSIMKISERNNMVATLKYEGIDGRVGIYEIKRMKIPFQPLRIE